MCVSVITETGTRLSVSVSIRKAHLKFHIIKNTQQSRIKHERQRSLFYSYERVPINKTLVFIYCLRFI